jgi:hypothetical protein
MNDDRTKLINLRVSIARTVQCLNFTNEQLQLPVMGKNYEDLHELAKTEEKGWNSLLAIVVYELLHFQQLRQLGMQELAKSFNDNEPFDDCIYPKI